MTSTTRPRSARGRHVAVCCLVITVGTFLTGWLALGDSIAERWYLWKLESGEDEERRFAAQKLAALPSFRAVPRLMDIVRSDESVRSIQPPNGKVWRWPFSHVTYRTQGAMTGILCLHKDYWSQFWPGEALVAIGPPAITLLVLALQHDDEFVRVAVSDVLARIGEEAVPALVEVIDDETAPIHKQKRALYALWRIGPGSAAAVPSLCGLLTKKGGWRRQRAAWVLGSVGANARAALPTLEERMQSETNGDTRWVIGGAISSIRNAIGTPPSGVAPTRSVARP